MPSERPSSGFDVTIVGGGLAGKAASIHLSKFGFKVVCIEPSESARQAVGESLDWSAPDLLNSLGLPMQHLVDSQIATWKRHVTLKLRDGEGEQYIPSEWLSGKPFNVELRTMHVDRLRLDQELQNIARDLGVEVVPDKVVKIERNGETILSVVTASGVKFSSPWFMDASGFGASLFAREFNIPAIQYGPQKVGLWTYFPISDPPEGTTLYMDPSPTDYLNWIWEIPINPKVVSVGLVTTGHAMKAMREQGLSVEEIFRSQLAKFPRFENLLRAESESEINVTSFRCRAHTRNSGPNWLIAGEAAAMVDPITANGVTSALRHAAEASSLIKKHYDAGKLQWHTRALYSARILLMANFFNSGIEKIVYEPPVRNRIGLGRSGTIYTSPAWSMNAVYARLKPRGMLSTGMLGIVLAAFRAGAWLLYQFCKMSSGKSPAQPA
jgi:flavin-dependent dehydrogenase